MAYFRCPLNRADVLPEGYTRVPHLTIDHSGHTFNSCIRGPGGQYVWPIEELFARRKFKRTVEERIARLNPYGHEEGAVIRGYYINNHRAQAWMRGDLVPLRQYEKKWGTRTGADIRFKQGRHKYVTMLSVMNGPPLCGERV